MDDVGVCFRVVSVECMVPFWLYEYILKVYEV